MGNAAKRKVETPLNHTLMVVKKPGEFRDETIPVQYGKELIKKRRHKNKFKDWIMPEQPKGYIKAGKNDIY